MGRDLSALVHGHSPVEEISRAADEITRRDDGVLVEHGQEYFPVETVHTAAESRQAVEDVLPVQ